MSVETVETPLDAPDMVELEDGRVMIQWGSGHTEGPYDPDEIALLAGDED